MEPLDLALRFGALALENGSSAALADRAFASVLKSAGIDDGFALWRLDFATAGRRCGGQVVVRTIGPIGVNLRRVAEVAALAARAARGAIPFESLAAELDRVAGIGSSYGPWTMLAVTGVSAGLYSKILTGAWPGFGIAFVAAALGQALRLRLLAAQVPTAGATLAAAVVSALTAAVGLRLRFGDEASATVIASVVYLIPGLPLINGFFDMASPRSLVLGVQRLLSATFTVALLAVAVALAVAVMR